MALGPLEDVLAQHIDDDGLKESFGPLGLKLSRARETRSVALTIMLREMNLLTLINSSLAHIYGSTTLSKYGLIRLNRFISSISREVIHLILSLV